LSPVNCPCATLQLADDDDDDDDERPMLGTDNEADIGMEEQELMGEQRAVNEAEGEEAAAVARRMARVSVNPNYYERNVLQA